MVEMEVDSMNDGKKCLICGAYLVWQGDNEIPDGRTESVYRCKNCGAECTSLEPTDSDKNECYSNYWKK